MRIEAAILVSATISLAPVWLMGCIGDEGTFLLLALLMFLPFYCLAIAGLVMLIHAVRHRFRLESMRSYIVLALATGALPLLALAPFGYYWAGLLIGPFITIALLRTPVVQGRPGTTARTSSAS
ncbi:MAG TPA: hypothetical protein VFU95_04555 [Telluria sp.]|nr:hypothetical protein [Telluria sp.]